jgi:hypothetical protein
LRPGGIQLGTRTSNITATSLSRKSVVAVSKPDK